MWTISKILEQGQDLFSAWVGFLGVSPNVWLVHLCHVARLESRIDIYAYCCLVVEWKEKKTTTEVNGQERVASVL